MSAFLPDLESAMHDPTSRRLALAALSAFPVAALAQAQPSDRSAAEQANLARLLRYHETVWVQRKSDATRDFMSDDFLSHSNPPEAPRGAQPAKQFMDTLFGAFPDLNSEPLINLVDGAFVVTAWTLTGTSRGPLFGAPPTGRPFRVSGVDLMRMRDGRFVEHWFGLGPLFPALLQQIAQPAPAK